MPSQTREELLTEKERERLINRQDTTDKKTRAANDIRVRKKLAAWLKNIPDVLLILEKLPKDQTNAVLSDEDIFTFFNLTEKAIHVRGFSLIEGRISWPKWSGYSGEVTDLDIWRSWHLHKHIHKLLDFHGHRNPLWDWDVLHPMEEDKHFRERISPEELRGMERIKHALKIFSKEPPEIVSLFSGSVIPHEIEPEEES
jgi:hypothetical protein